MNHTLTQNCIIDSINKENKMKTIGEIVAEDYRAATIFRSYKLDFCCGGNKSVEEACERKNVNPDEVHEALKNLGQIGAPEHNYNSWKSSFLIDYIVNNHHGYVKEKLPEIGFYSHKVARVHGDRHPELIEMHQLFTELSQEFTDHMMKEEQILFPFIKKMEEAQENNEPMPESHFQSVNNPITMMEMEHETAGNLMGQLEELSNSFTPPTDACATYRVYFENLKAFQGDLHKHVHLENNILFPKAKKMESMTA